MSENTGVKFDTGKTRHDLLPTDFLVGTSDVLAFGAEKYGAYNWMGGMKWGRVFGACMRHLWKWWSPWEPDVDEETGLSHLAHAACCIAFLMVYEKRKIGEDDRAHIA